MVVIARNWKLRTILLALFVIFMGGHLMMALSTHFSVALVARFVSGLPHGAFFGTGVIVANKLAKEGKSATAVSIMVMGMTVANVPVSSWICHQFTWRLVFVFTTLWGVFTIWGIHHWVPELPALPRTNLKGQFLFQKKPEPWYNWLSIWVMR